MKRFAVLTLLLSVLVLVLPAPARADIVYDVYVDESGNGYYTLAGVRQGPLASTTSDVWIPQGGGRTFSGVLYYTLPTGLTESTGGVELLEGSDVSDLIWFINHGASDGANLAFFSLGGGSNAADLWSPADPPPTPDYNYVTASEGVVYTSPLGVRYHFQSDDGGAVPEPGTIASLLSGLGLLGLAALRRRR